MNSMYFYVDSNGQQQGPIAANDLPKNGVTPQTLVWKNGMSGWQPAGSVAELSRIFAPQPSYAPPQPTYAPPQPVSSQPYTSPDTSNNGVAIVGFVFGLCSLLGWIIPILGVPISITGLILSIRGQKSEKKGLATAGLILSIIGLVATIVNASIGAYMGAQGNLF